jgi:hypothetical protein
MSPQSQNFLQGLRMVRVLKMVRAVRFLQKLGQLEQKDTTGTLKYFVSIFRAIFCMVFVSHFLACFFYMMVNADSVNWMSSYDEELLDMQRTRPSTRYVVSLYWAVVTISTLGYGDVLPSTETERIFCIFSAISGGIVFSYTLGNISSLISSSTGSAMRLENKLICIKEYLAFRNMDTDFKRLVLQYIGQTFRTSGMLHDEVNLLASLPRDLRVESLRRIAHKVMQENPEQVPRLFSGMEHHDLGNLFVRLVPRWFEAGAEIYRPRDHGEEMYFVYQGSVVLKRMSVATHAGAVASAIPANVDSVSGNIVADSDDEIVAVGAHFGELCLFEDICNFRHETAISQGTDDGFGANCFVLTRDSMNELAFTTPKFCSELYELCSLRSHLSGVNNALFEKMNAAHPPRHQLHKTCFEHKLAVIEKYEQAMSQLAVPLTARLPSATGSVKNSQVSVLAHVSGCTAKQDVSDSLIPI